MEKRAIIIGSTGLTGSFLLDLLLKSDAYHKIIATVRNPSTSKNIKLKYIETDFKKLDQVSAELMADCIFICIGSTMAKSGSKGAFLKVDYDIPVDLAHIAIKNGVKKIINKSFKINIENATIAVVDCRDSARTLGVYVNPEQSWHK